MEDSSNMQRPKLGVLHPGNMGIFVAASAQNSGCDVYWASDSRSPKTHERAAKFDLNDASSLANLCQTCSIVVSVCPPHAAEDVAEQVVDQGFGGLYVDANAISPDRVRKMRHTVEKAGMTFVDGGIVGGPVWEGGRTWLHLAGPEAETVAACFSGGPLETSILGEEVGKASAIKMCYAAYTKGTSALLCGILATAEQLGVRRELEEQWESHWPGFAEQTAGRARRVTAKAWRFAGEMNEISSTFEGAGLPGGFHAAAGTLYRRLAHFKDAPSIPELEDVLAALALSDDQLA
jgi:3-hydroxyisobutyrate dehydrogenase-like beta-hydroxyacid dehydrogenase